METGPSSNMTCLEKVKRYPVYYFLNICLYTLILTVIYFIEKLLFIILRLITFYWPISVLFQIILHLILIRYLVLKVAFAGLSFLITRPSRYRFGKRQATQLYNELKTIKSALIDIFDKQRPIQELNRLSTIQRNLKSANSIIKYFYQVFSKIKERFGELTLDQNTFYQNITNLYNLFEQSEIIKLLNNIIKQLRAEKIFSIKDLSLNEKEKINKEKIEKEKYIEQMNIPLDLLIEQLKDYICINLCICSPRYIRNYFKNFLFASIHQFQVELENFFVYEEKQLQTKDGNSLEYIMIKNNNGKKYNNFERKLMIMCGPNGQPYQIFSRNILLKKYLSKGIDVLCWNYRGYGFSTGKATFNNLRTDIIELYEEIKKMKIYTKIGVHGISIGGIPSCYLASQKKEIVLLISDRNFGQIEYIAKNYPLGKYLVYLYNCLFIPSSRNVENYIESKSYKIILNDPNDEIVTEEGSLKTLLSEEFCKRYLVLNPQNSDISIYKHDNNDNKDDSTTIELESLNESNNIYKKKNIIKDNSKDKLLNEIIVSTDVSSNKIHNKSALDIILSDDKKNFINCLINISKALNDEKLIIKKISFCNKITKMFNKSKFEDDNYSNLKEEELQNSVGLCDFIRDKITTCLQAFKSSGDILYKLTSKKSRYNQNLFIENFFNNLFIWGICDKRDDYGCAYNSTEYIDIMLSKIIDMLNLFLSSQEIISYKKINIIKDIEDFHNLLIKMKNNIKFLGIKNKNNFTFFSDGNNYEKELIKLGRGHFVSLNCGHNGALTLEENKVFKHYCKESPLFKKEKSIYDNNINTSSENIDNYEKENIFDEKAIEDLDTSVLNLTKSLDN